MCSTYLSPHAIRTDANGKDGPESSLDKDLKHTILSEGWIVSDCESEGINEENVHEPHSHDLPPPPPAADEIPPADSGNEIPAAEVSSAPAAEEDEEVSPPVLEPHVNSEGHRQICSILLPRLFAVMRDPQYSRKSPRDQIREACYRLMVLLWCSVVFQVSSFKVC